MRGAALAVACCCQTVLILMAPAVAPAATTLILDGRVGPPPYQQWIDRALVPTPSTSVVLHVGPCPSGPSWAGGCADLDRRIIWLTPQALHASTFFHELAHIFDATVMSDAARVRFTREVLGRESAWRAAPSMDPPSEQFSEAYSLCARHRRLRAIFFGVYGYEPSPRMHLRACALIRDAARHPALPPAVTPTRRVCRARVAGRCRPLVSRLDGYPDSPSAASATQLVVSRATTGAVRTHRGVAVDGGGLASLTPASLLTPVSPAGG